MPPEVAEVIPEIVYEAEEFAEIDEEEAVPETAAKPETETDTEAETDTETAADLNDKTGLPSDEAALSEDGVYTAKEDVALYLHLYGHLPSNFITKKEAEKLGWKEVPWNPSHRACVLAETASAITKDFFRKRTDAFIPSAILTRWVPTAGVRKELYSPMTA